MSPEQNFREKLVRVCRFTFYGISFTVKFFVFKISGFRWTDSLTTANIPLKRVPPGHIFRWTNIFVTRSLCYSKKLMNVPIFRISSAVVGCACSNPNPPLSNTRSVGPCAPCVADCMAFFRRGHRGGFITSWKPSTLRCCELSISEESKDECMQGSSPSACSSTKVPLQRCSLTYTSVLCVSCFATSGELTKCFSGKSINSQLSMFVFSTILCCLL